MLDILITHGYVLTMEGNGIGLIPNGAVGIRGNRIAVVGASDEVLKQHQAHRYIDAAGKAVLPGLVDCHMHSSHTIARGLAQDIEDLPYGGIGSFMQCADQEAIKIASLASIADAVLCGTTTICDDVNDMSLILENHLKIGNRAFVSEMLHELPANIPEQELSAPILLDHKIGEQKFQNLIEMHERYQESNNGRIRFMVAPLSADLCSLELLEEASAYARKAALPLHIHICQSNHENQRMVARYGKRTIPFLEENGMFGRNWIAVHMTHATEGELRTVATSGASMVMCANSDALMYGAIAPASQYMDLNGVVGLGTGSASGNNRNNLFAEMKMAAFLSRVSVGKGGGVFPSWKVLRMATIEGAATIRMQDELGSLRQGKLADIILVDLERPSLVPIMDGPIRTLVPNLVYAGNGGEVEMSIINGRIIVENGRLNTVDMEAIQKDLLQTGARFQAHLEADPNIWKTQLAQWTQQGLY